jgi:hypothetical protein
MPKHNSSLSIDKIMILKWEHLVGRRLKAEPGIESPEALRFIQLILQPAHSTLAPTHRDTITSYKQRLIFFQILYSTILHQDLYVFGPPGFGSGIYLYGFGSFHQQGQKWRKTLMCPVLWILYDFLFLKNDVNVILKRNKLRNFVTGTDSEIRIRIRTKMS